MSDQSHIAEQMATVRSRGLRNARDLSQEVERLSDWREYVRAHPVPLALAAASLGYWVVPSKQRSHGTAAPPADRTSGASNVAKPASTTEQEQHKTARTVGLGGAAMGFIGSLAANAIRNYIAEQMHSLIQGPRDHDALQRQTSHRFSRR